MPGDITHHTRIKIVIGHIFPAGLSNWFHFANDLCSRAALFSFWFTLSFIWAVRHCILCGLPVWMWRWTCAIGACSPIHTGNVAFTYLSFACMHAAGDILPTDGSHARTFYSQNWRWAAFSMQVAEPWGKRALGSQAPSMILRCSKAEHSCIGEGPRVCSVHRGIRERKLLC